MLFEASSMCLNPAHLEFSFLEFLSPQHTWTSRHGASVLVACGVYGVWPGRCAFAAQPLIKLRPGPGLSGGNEPRSIIL